jgi:signal transduction histidine kinase
MTERKRILLSSIGIMAAVGVSTAAIAIYVLYEASLTMHRSRLVEIVQSRARIIEAVSYFDAEFSEEDMPGGATAATLSQIVAAHEKFEGFGRTGEFTLARRQGDQIVWLLRHRHNDVATPEPTPYYSDLAEPMRRALNGECGSVVGLDYRGSEVLAAHEKIRGVDWGVVAKIDMEEIREPFARAGSMVLGISIFAIAIGVGFIASLTSPLLRRIEARTHELQEAHESLRIHSSEEALAVERERRKLAVDLHDGLSQLLAIANMKLAILRRTNKTEKIDSEVREIESLINKAHARTGEVTFQLCPPILHDVGLLEATAWLADDLKRRFGLQVTVEGDGPPRSLDETTRISLFRSVNELLINVVKHAQTDKSVVRVRHEDGFLTIAVEDEGVGFSPDPGAAGYGLFSVRERLHHLGGTVRVDSVPGDGTRIVLVAPLPTAGSETRNGSA